MTIHGRCVDVGLGGLRDGEPGRHPVGLRWGIAPSRTGGALRRRRALTFAARVAVCFAQRREVLRAGSPAKTWPRIAMDRDVVGGGRVD